MEDELREGKTAQKIQSERLEKEHERLQEMQRVLKQDKSVGMEAILRDKADFEDSKCCLFYTYTNHVDTKKTTFHSSRLHGVTRDGG